MHGEFLGSQATYLVHLSPVERLGHSYRRLVLFYRRYAFVAFFLTPSSRHLKDREIEIIHALKERILVYDQAITKACDTCAELDCLLCFASASTSFNYCRPHMSEENVLLIKRGRYARYHCRHPCR